jgi:predicted negative regulator of RcsB-dependent stress response
VTPGPEREIEHLRTILRRVVYGVLVAVIAAVAIGVGNVYYTNRVDERRARAAAQVEIARQAVAEQNRQLVCSLALAQAEALQDATSEPGRKSYAAWRAMVDRFHCS